MLDWTQPITIPVSRGVGRPRGPDQKTQKFFRQHETNIRRMAREGLSLKEIHEQLGGISYGTLHKNVKRLSIAITDGRGGKTTNRARDRQIVEMRQTMTLEEISQHFGITRERVRQILEKHGDPTLIGYIHGPDPIEKKCKHCGEAFGLDRRPSITKRQEYCSNKCSGAASRSDECRDRLWRAVELRRAGKIWREIGAAIGDTGWKHLPQQIKKKAAQEGWDVSDILPEHGYHHVLSPAELTRRQIAGKKRAA